MTTRQQRKARRAAERLSHYTPVAAPSASSPTVVPDFEWTEIPAPPPPALPAESHPTRADINRLNAQHSTGPTSDHGKSVSSQNRFEHGCTGKFMLLPGEDADEFQRLQDVLFEEHKPTTAMEALLVRRMAEHFWLSQRAMRFQSTCFDNLPAVDEKRLALFLRYQTTHDRQFHKCSSELAKLRNERRKEESGFVSQKAKEAEEVRRQELHDAKVRALNAKSDDQELETEVRKTINAPLPGEMQIPFDTLKSVFSLAIVEVSKQLGRNAVA